jgi:hypothetical protein
MSRICISAWLILREQYYFIKTSKLSLSQKVDSRKDNPLRFAMNLRGYEKSKK